ncbi:hypothetical protein pb186bvf_004099 [Paramecium bursaria]
MNIQRQKIINKYESIINSQEQGYKGMVEIMGKEIKQLLGLLDIKQKEIDSLVRQSSQYRLIEEQEKYKLQAQLDNFVKESTYQKQLNQEIQIQKETELFQQYEKEVDKIKHQDRIIRNLQQDISNLRQSNQNQLERLSTFEKLIQEKDKLRKDIEETHKIEKESLINQQQQIKNSLDLMVTDNKKLQEIVQYQECQINNLKSQIKESQVINSTTLYDLSFDQKRLKDQIQQLLMQIDNLTHLCEKQEFKLTDQQQYIDKLIHQLNQNRSTQGSIMEDFKRRMEQSSILQVENLKLSYGTQIHLLNDQIQDLKLKEVNKTRKISQYSTQCRNSQLVQSQQ